MDRDTKAVHIGVWDTRTRCISWRSCVDVYWRVLTYPTEWTGHRCPSSNPTVDVIVERLLHNRYPDVYWNIRKCTSFMCLLWIEKVRVKEKTCKWGSVRWETKSKSWEIYMTRIHWVGRQNKLCLLWVKKAIAKDKTYIWVLGLWKTEG